MQYAQSRCYCIQLLVQNVSLKYFFSYTEQFALELMKGNETFRNQFEK